MEIHDNKQPYEGVFCKNVFNSKRNFKRHIEIHDNEEPYQCQKGENESEIMQVMY